MQKDFSIGIIGGGQLARMMYPAAVELGLRVGVLAEGPDVSAAQVFADVQVGDYTDPATVRAFAARHTAITFDHEHVPTDLLHELEDAGVAVRPGPDALVHAQDKAVMRAKLSADGFPCPVFEIVETPAQLVAFGDRVGWPIIAKTSRGGYDGKGVFTVDAAAGAAEPFGALPPGAVIVAEEFVAFRRELSALVARRPGGEAVAYPISESVQEQGICRETTTPAPGLDAARASEIQEFALGIAADLGVVGVLAVELMERADGRVVVNELAMRPHNTGHWSIDGAVTSQFENHLRAVADLPLGDPAATASHVVMSNVLGGSRADLVGGLGEVLVDAGVRPHLYGKAVKPGRKVGHVTVCGGDLADVQGRARLASEVLEGRKHG